MESTYEIKSMCILNAIDTDAKALRWWWQFKESPFWLFGKNSPNGS